MKKTMGNAAGRRRFLPEHLKGGVCCLFVLAAVLCSCSSDPAPAADTWTPDGGFSGYDLASVSVSNDASDLHVSLTFENPPAIWHRGRIGILIDML